MKVSFISLKKSHFLEISGPVDLLTKVMNFMLLFEHEVNEEESKFIINPIQKNSIDLKNKIIKFLKDNKDVPMQLNKIIAFLNNLPTDNYFIMRPTRVDDTAEMIQYYKLLEEYHLKDGIALETSISNINWGDILKNYDINFFGQQEKIIEEGSQKKSRVCRFCRTQAGEENEFCSIVTFKNKAHAFSEALGNKKVITRDECDSCNTRFGTAKGIESSLIKYLKVFRSLYELEGKGGTKILKGKNFSLDSSGILSINQEIDILDSSLQQNIETKLYLNEPFIPQDIYRCLSKFVMSVLDKEEIINFQKTIDWVNKKFDAEDLPSISWVQDSAFFRKEPLLYYFKRKNLDYHLPYMVGVFHYADIVFEFIIPFSTMDERTFIDEDENQSFWTEFNNIRSNFNWSQSSFTSIEQRDMLINLKIKGIEFGM